MNLILPSLLQPELGSLESAREIARRAAQQVAGYRTFLARRAIGPEEEFARLPSTDKAGYLKLFPLPELVGEDFSETFNIFSSSGSSGHPFYWPQLKASHRTSQERLRQLLETNFAIHHRRTLAIVGLALGSWIGGDHFSWLLKSLALDCPYPFAAFSPGNKHAEIIAILNSAAPFVDRFLLVCCPSAIAHLILRADQAGTPLPLEKMRYLVLGEPFPEIVRTTLETRARLEPGEALMLSIYGSADTGVLGFESPASVALRRVAQAEPSIAAELGLGPVIPHFFHQADPGAYLETPGAELCVTKWQGIPLVRYNLHDHAQLYAWPLIAARFAAWGRQFPALKPLLDRIDPEHPFPQPGLIAITGRADRCFILCGTNLTEAMIDDAIRAPDLVATLTGAYSARIDLEQGRQRLALTVEYRPDRGTPETFVEAVYRGLIQALGRVQPEFQNDWENIYRTWDADPERRILQLDLAPWPELSQNLERKIKQRGIVA